MLTRRRLILLIALISALSVSFDIGRLAGILNSSFASQKDFVQFYLMGKALVHGDNIYEPLPTLAQRYDPTLQPELRHPSPYPPFVAVVGAPFAFVSYTTGAIIWTLFESACLAAMLLLLLKHFGWTKASTPVVVILLLVLPWRPVYTDLYLGQMMMTISLLLTGCWLALRKNREIVAGLLLGCVLALKLYGWPILLWLLLTKRFKPASVAISILCVSGLIALGFLSIQSAIDYYTKIGPTVAGIYRYDPFNFSLSAVGFRLWGAWLGVALATLSLCFFLWLACKQDCDRAFMIMLCGSVILAPIAWLHYLITLVPALCLVGSRSDLSKIDLLIISLLLLALIPGFEIYAHRYDPFATWPPLLFVLGLVYLIASKSIHIRNEVVI